MISVFFIEQLLLSASRVENATEAVAQQGELKIKQSDTVEEDHAEGYLNPVTRQNPQRCSGFDWLYPTSCT